MNNKLKYGLIGGSVGLGLYLIIQTISWVILSITDMCLTCFMISTILDFIPLVMLNLNGKIIIIISSIFYFIIGCVIGVLVEIFKKYYK